MVRAGGTGILKPCKQRPRAVTIKDFPSAQVIPLTPLNNEYAKPRAGSLWNCASRVARARFVSDQVNTQRAEVRAAMLRAVVVVRAERVWLTDDEDIKAVEEQQETQPLQAAPSPSPNKDEKVVRFADEADTEQFDFLATEQCELGSAQELCLTTFLSRVNHAYNFSHEFNEAEARDLALRVRVEVEMQQRDAEDEGKKTSGESFFVDQSSGLDEASEGPKRRTKECFRILDARRMPQHASSSSEGKRWQDLVRQAAG